ncbi:hypothetical protein OF829_09535 [Sphingomonas sp. LB-2]|uniref:hypothetical protein n=1 Tax=Sphingomonas caeni TaxID=2984949 RepID=UPI00222F5084|nr:hypothetical protein [Sphingomonas caeni]MCW3847484.1 hypothetical protein [Sphingomonas caeni]
MVEREAWERLGIKWTRDAAVIRIACARKLKTADAGAGAAGLLTLRAAYEDALASARGADDIDNWLEAPPTGPAGPFDPGQAALPPAIGQLNALFEAALREDRRWLSAEEKLALRGAWAAIADWSGEGEEERRAADRVVRGLILHWRAWAVGLVPFAVDHFDWTGPGQVPDEEGLIADILWRYRGIQFLQRVRRPGHPHHAAWVELTSDAGPGVGRGRCSPRHVHEIQAVIRHVWPEMEGELNPGRVALWANNTANPAHPENPKQESKLLRNIGMAIAALIVIRLAFGVFAGLLAMLGIIGR